MDSYTLKAGPGAKAGFLPSLATLAVEQGDMLVQCSDTSFPWSRLLLASWSSLLRLLLLDTDASCLLIPSFPSCTVLSTFSRLCGSLEEGKQEDVNLELCALLRIGLALKEEQGGRREQKEVKNEQEESTKEQEERTKEQEETEEEQETVVEGQREPMYEQGTAMSEEVSSVKRNIPTDILNKADEAGIEHSEKEHEEKVRRRGRLRLPGVGEDASEGESKSVSKDVQNKPYSKTKKRIIKKVNESETEIRLEVYGNTKSVSNKFFAGEQQDLDEKIKSMMIIGENMAQDGKRKATACQVCGKEGYRTQIRDHIEANHVDEIGVPCNLCGKTFSSRNVLRNHKYCHKLDSMLEYFDDGENKWKCVVCGKLSSHKAHIRSHIKTHIEGMSFPCHQCSKVFRSNNSLTKHVCNFHSLSRSSQP